MSNVHLCHPNRADAGSVSGGGWMAGLPANNLLTRRLSKVARTSNALTANSQFVFNAGSAIAVGCVALCAHNLSVDAKVKIQGNSSNSWGSPSYDSGWISVWPTGMIDQSLLEWEDDNFWLGTLSSSAVAGYRTPFVFFLPTAQIMQYWNILIDNTTNPDGFITIGRLFIGPVFIPTRNMSYGMSLVVNDASVTETSLTGEEFFDQRQHYRVHKFDLDFLTKIEAYSNMLDMQRNIGTTNEIFVSIDPDDTSNAPRLSFMGRMQTVQPVVNTNWNIYKNSFEIREIV